MSLRTINKKHCQTLPAELFITLNKPTLLLLLLLIWQSTKKCNSTIERNTTMGGGTAYRRLKQVNGHLDTLEAIFAHF